MAKMTFKDLASIINARQNTSLYLNRLPKKPVSNLHLFKKINWIHSGLNHLDALITGVLSQAPRIE